MVLPAFALLLVMLVLPEAAEAQKRRETAPAQTQARTFRDCADCPEMVVVPAGEFMMGSPPSERGRDQDEGPQRKVTFAQPFAVGKFEVTFAEWDACVAEAGCTHKPGDESWGRGKRPVINVSWDDAKEYVAWLAKKTGKPYRLLTGGRMGVCCTRRDQSDSVRTRRSRRDRPSTTGRPTTTPISSTASGPAGRLSPEDHGRRLLPEANAFGLHDMHGNVWEWVEDCYKDSYAGAPTDGSAVQGRDCILRILRGGSWNYYPRLLRSAYRYATAPGIRTEYAGFRVARAM